MTLYEINSILMDNEEDLDILIPMYNLLEYSGNCSMASERFWDYYRDKIDYIDDDASNS